MVKILIVRLGALGDILHALPAITGIRAALPDATIGWVIEENHAMAAAALKECLGQRGLRLLAPQLPLDPVAEAWANAEIARLGLASFAIVNPGAGWGGKQWPAERFGEVARALARHNLKTLVNAGPDEDALAQAVIAASGGNAFALNCSIGQL